MIQDIIDTGLVQWGASKEEVKVILGGDQPWTRRVIGVSTCPQVGSMFNEGIWNAWVWTPTWSALLDFGGFNPEAANRGVYTGVVHGIASRPKSKPKPAAAPAGGPPQPHPPNPADAFAKALGAISPALDRQGTVCRLRSSGDLANRSSVDLATAVPPPLERRQNAARTVA